MWSTQVVTIRATKFYQHRQISRREVRSIYNFTEAIRVIRGTSRMDSSKTKIMIVLIIKQPLIVIKVGMPAV